MGTVLFALFDVVVLYCMVVGTYGVYSIHRVHDS
jgi:hypothetical protein